MRYQIILFILILFAGISGKATALAADEKMVRSNDSVKVEKTEKIVKFHIRPSMGLTFGDSNADGERITNLQWLAKLILISLLSVQNLI